MKEQIIDKNKQLENAKCYDLAICEVVEYSRKDLQRIIGNEERANNRQRGNRALTKARKSERRVYKWRN